jgi:hypothetical protein
MVWNTPQGKYTLGNVIDLGIRVGIQLLEFNMQVKKSLSLDIPVNTPEVLVVRLEIGQKQV